MIPLFLTNCKKDSKDNSIANTYSTSINIAYKDNLGNDLLDTFKQQHFSVADFHIYYLINGKKTEVNNPVSNWSKAIYKPSFDSLNEYLLRVELYENSDVNIDTTLLKLNSTTIDTITCTYFRTTGLTVIAKVWYNGVLKWDFANNLPPIITIIK